jgi:hypothetical protein
MCVVVSVYVKYFISDKLQGKKNTPGQVLRVYIAWWRGIHDLVPGNRLMERGCVSGSGTTTTTVDTICCFVSARCCAFFVLLLVFFITVINVSKNVLI